MSVFINIIFLIFEHNTIAVIHVGLRPINYEVTQRVQEAKVHVSKHTPWNSMADRGRFTGYNVIQIQCNCSFVIKRTI